ncbi:MAG TPA: type II toxin-antitoxin system VapC family toxin [Rhodanobacteraceae bacterium]|nr:type II toxin-antitoxin system VapC family toxin [Rhodanobacteraceae bacterium]
MGEQVSLLLDTHAFLWAVMQPDKLSSKVRKRLENPSTEIILSAASAWEIATKHRLGKLPSAKALLADFDEVIRQLDARMLAVNHVHALKAGGFRQSHRDPFDRMLAAQAQVEGLTLVSKDTALLQFGIKLLW